MPFIVEATEVGVDLEDGFNFFFAVLMSFFIGFFGTRWPLVTATVFALLLDCVVLSPKFSTALLFLSIAILDNNTDIVRKGCVISRSMLSVTSRV